MSMHHNPSLDLAVVAAFPLASLTRCGGFWLSRRWALGFMPTTTTAARAVGCPAERQSVCRALSGSGSGPERWQTRSSDLRALEHPHLAARRLHRFKAG